jgi:hypothetical protein
VTAAVTAKPDRCTCVSAVEETLAETLACPLGWWGRPGGGWAHEPWWAR